VALKQKDWRKAQSSAGKALEIEMSNEKALYRRAQAAAEIEEYDEAKRDVKKLLEGDAKHREGRALLTRIKKLEAVQAKKDAKVFGGMFSKLGGLYKDETKLEGPGGEGFDPSKASGDAPKLQNIDIGHGFTMDEIGDEDGGDGEGMVDVVPAKSPVSKEFA
jgi:FK506-binding protein 4/5